MTLSREQVAENKEIISLGTNSDMASELEAVISSVLADNSDYDVEKFENILSNLKKLGEYNLEIVNLVIRNLNRIAVIEIDLGTILEGNVNIPHDDLKNIIQGQVWGAKNITTLVQAGLLEKYREHARFADEIVELNQCGLLSDSNLQKLIDYEKKYQISIAKIFAELRQAGLATQENFTKLMNDKVVVLNSNVLCTLRKMNLLTQDNFNNLINIADRTKRDSLNDAFKILIEINLNSQEYVTLLMAQTSPLTVARGFQQLIIANLFTSENRHALTDALQKSGATEAVNMIFDQLIAADIFTQDNFLQVLNKSKYAHKIQSNIFLLQNNNLFSRSNKVLAQQNFDKLIRCAKFSDSIILNDELTQKDFDAAIKEIEKPIDSAEINLISQYLAQGLRSQHSFFQIPGIVANIATMSAGNGALDEKERYKISYKMLSSKKR